MAALHRARRFLAPAALVAVVALGASACVDDEEPTLVDATEQGDGGDTTEAAAGAPDVTGTDAGAQTSAPAEATDCETGPEVTAADAPDVTVPDEPAPDELVIEDIEVGEGHEVAAGDQVSLQYTGVLYDTGETFDSSWESLQPLPFTVGEGAVIPGFDEGVVGMQPGGRRQITIPPDLGYGDQGAGGVIPPGATLVFVVDLVEVCS